MTTPQTPAFNPYLTMLLGPQREALMELLAYLSGVDGDVSLEEVAYIAESSERLGVEAPVGELFEAFDRKGLDAICAHFKRADTQAIALAELIGIAFADGHYDASERAGVRTIAAAMHVEGDLVDQVEAWVEDGLHWQREGQRLMGLAPAP